MTEPVQIGNLQPFIFGQEPRRDLLLLRFDRPIHVLSAVTVYAPSEAPSLPGARINAHLPAGFGIA